MVTPVARKKAARSLVERHRVSVRRACRVLHLSESTYRYRRQWRELEGLRVRIQELAADRPRAGYRTIHYFLKVDGWKVGAKQVYRVYRDAGLAVRRRKRKRTGVIQRQPAAVPEAPNVRWSMDFMSDSLENGRSFRVLNVVDDFSREALAMEVDTSITGQRVSRVLDRLVEERGAPAAIVVDNGSEFTSRALDQWSYRTGIRLDFIEPGKPIQNCFVESFNGRVRDECLNQHWFTDLGHARRIVEAWRLDYNHVRPHSSLGYTPPAVYAEGALRSQAPSAPTRN